MTDESVQPEVAPVNHAARAFYAIERLAFKYYNVNVKVLGIDGGYTMVSWHDHRGDESRVTVEALLPDSTERLADMLETELTAHQPKKES